MSTLKDLYLKNVDVEFGIADFTMEHFHISSRWNDETLEVEVEIVDTIAGEIIRYAVNYSEPYQWLTIILDRA